jgi:hypothetical protein
MSALAVMKQAAACGVRVSLRDDKLALKATVRPSQQLLARLQLHKAQIIALLRQASCAEPDEVEIEGRKAMAMGGVPEPYLWQRIQCQRPQSVTEDEWRQAINDAGLFLDRWGSDSSPGGLVWFLQGEAVRALGPEHAVTESGRTFDRGTS